MRHYPRRQAPWAGTRSGQLRRKSLRKRRPTRCTRSLGGGAAEDGAPAAASVLGGRLGWAL
jgi:hypothetical protein